MSAQGGAGRRPRARHFVVVALAAAAGPVAVASALPPELVVALPEALPGAPMELLLPGVVEALLLVVSLVPGVVVDELLLVVPPDGATTGGGVTVVEVVDSVLRSPHAARETAAIRARAAQRASGVVIIR
jgi:hypothetical protein